MDTYPGPHLEVGTLDDRPVLEDGLGFYIELIFPPIWPHCTML